MKQILTIGLICLVISCSEKDDFTSNPKNIRIQHENDFGVPIYPNAKYEKKETEVSNKYLYKDDDSKIVKIEWYSTSDSYESVVVPFYQ